MKKGTRKIVRISTLLIIAILVGVTLYFNLSNPTQIVEAGDRYIDFELETLDGDVVRVSDLLEEQGVILNFWGTWCKPCREEMPDLNELYNEYDRAVEVIAVNVRESNQQINQFLNSLPEELDFVIALDRERDVTKAYNIGPMPTTIAINQDGVVVKKQETQLSREDIVSFIELAEK